MPIAWFSTEEYDVYHFCLNCPRVTQIELENLDYHLLSLVASQHPKLRRCVPCRLLRLKGECIPAYSIDEVRKVIVQPFG